MKKSLKKDARMRRHTAMMAAFYVFIDTVADRPMEGDRRWNDMLAAFKAGWQSA